METRSKRRRLMSTYVSLRPRPDLPARFESLIDDTLTTVLEFVGNKSYSTFGGINKHCREIYITSGMTKETYVYGYAPLSAIIDRIEGVDEDNDDWEVFEGVGKGVVLYNRRDVLDWALKERNNDLLKEICEVAAEEGRKDILNKVWNKVEDEDDKEYVFDYVDVNAARGGKLNVSKWIDKKGLPLPDNTYTCARGAAANGHLHILEWLRKKRRLRLEYYEVGIDLCCDAIDGDHLHVLKWLREKGVHWSDEAFPIAAKGGYLEILQWLHNEGCPWPDYVYRVYADALKPEVMDWLRENGYANRIQDE